MLSTRSKSSPAVMVLAVLVALLLLYLLPFCAILVDELVLRTYFISSVLPGWVKDWVEVIYWPLLKWFG